MSCLAFLSVTLALVPCVLFRPSHVVRAPAFAVVLGFGLGFLYPAQRNVVALLIPGGLEGRVMGVYQCMGAVMTWLPPLMFSVLCGPPLFF